MTKKEYIQERGTIVIGIEYTSGQIAYIVENEMDRDNLDTLHLELYDLQQRLRWLDQEWAGYK